ncbi:MAG: hypothetical protein IPN03_03135 [Holophagales bacterium]|nr:hypothetical protein [Holophagales bacterium]
MIPVALQPEPEGFDEKVRQKGSSWLRGKGLSASSTLPDGESLQSYWRACLDDLHHAYKGVCAYLSVYIERVLGAGTVDHFVPKSRSLGLAYEWRNYRLACSRMNSRKRDYETVLDPFDLDESPFHLELVTGKIYPKPFLPPALTASALATIERLGLDDADCREMRTRHFDECWRGDVSPAYLSRVSPFVYQEARRQGLL